MALHAESIVQEWLARQGFFTIRGLKEGVREMDLLAVRPSADRHHPEAWHVEVQTSFRPVSYITKLSKRLSKELGKGKTTAFVRSPEMLEECVADWVKNKFRHPDAVARRESLWRGAEWKPVLVHGVVKHREELDLIAEHGVELVALRSVLECVCGGDPSYRTSGADFIDVIEYWGEENRS